MDKKTAQRLVPMARVFKLLSEAHDDLGDIFDGQLAFPEEGGVRSDLFFACEKLTEAIDLVIRAGNRIAGEPFEEDERGTIMGYDKAALIEIADGLVGEKWSEDPFGIIGLMLQDAFDIAIDPGFERKVPEPDQ